jgi:hypothetical protein
MKTTTTTIVSVQRGRSEIRFLVPHLGWDVPHEPEVAGYKVFFRGQRGSPARKTGVLGPLVNGYATLTS